MDPQQQDREEHESSPAVNPPSLPGNSEDDFEAASKATEEEDYSQFTPQLRRKKRWPKIVVWSVVVVVLAGLAVGDYLLLMHKSSPKTSNTARQTTTHNSPSVSNANTTTQTKPYTSDDLNLSLKYPENWVVADNNSKLTVTSPVMQLTGADGQSQAGQVTLAMQGESGADFSMFKQGSAVAVLASQKVTYTSPTSTQRADTYISFLQYAATTAHSALDGIFVTGDNGYQYGQTIPEADVTKIDPDIRITFTKCANANCTGTPTALSISSKMWNDTSFATPIVNMIKSLQLQ